MTGRHARWLTAGTIPALFLAVLPASGAAAGTTPASAATARTATARAATAGRAAAATGSLKIGVRSAVGTVQGPARTLALPGNSGDYVRLHSMGTVGVSTPDGRTVWQVSPRSLFAAWHLRSADALPLIQDPGPPLIRHSEDPFRIWRAEQDGVADMHPVATGYLAGSRTPDVAIAETAGVTVGLSGELPWPFDVPGSRLHEGTFVTVLNGRTGQVLYSRLYPGYVTQLAMTGGMLVVGDETGDPSSPSQFGSWGSVTTVRALSFGPSAGGRLTARTAWTYTTHAPWALLLDMEPAGGDVAVDWSDTPLGLGVPGPPDGHVVLIGPDGSVRWTVPTPGYPILSGYDASRKLLVIADETDPTESIGYTLAGLRLSDGSTAVSVPVTGVLPTALSVGDATGPRGAGGRGGTWFVGGVDTTKRLTDGVNFRFTAGQVTAVDPGRGRVLWSAQLSGAGRREPYPVSVLASGAGRQGGIVLVASSNPAPNPTPRHPFGARNDLRALSARDGRQIWDRSGDLADPLSVRLAGPPGRPWVAGVTDDEDAVGYDLATGSTLSVTPLLTDLDAAVPAQVNGRPAVIAGSQSGGVFALDASDLSHVIWQTYVGGAVHQIALARPVPAGPPVLVVAATSRVDVLDIGTGRIRIAKRYPGQDAWNVTVGRLGPHRAGVVVATDRLSAFDAGTGRTLWTYRPPVPSYFSNAAIVDGVTVADYQNQVPVGGQPTTMAAVGIDARGHVAWTAPADPSTVAHPTLWHGVFASPGIPGAGTTGVALGWQDSNGAGQVDVRDAVTGKLLYSNVSSDLYDQKGWAIDPALGLIAVGAGSVLIRPSGPVTTGLSGVAAAVTDSASAPVVLVADNEIFAYPGAKARSLGGQPAAIDNTFTPGALVPVGPAAGGRVIALPEDLLAFQVVDAAEEGLPTLPAFDPYQIGVDVLRISGTPPASTAPLRHASRARPPRPAVLAVGTPRPGIAAMLPQLKLKVHRYTRAGRPVLAQAAPAGYDPATIGAYLGLTGDGAGQTVAVVDAYRDPRIVADVNTFSGQFGLPKVCGTAGAGRQCFDFKVTAPHGTAGENADWALETSLDIEWIHAVAPRAAVRLVQAHDQSFASLFAAVSAAAALRPDAISMSWGYPGGEFSGETYYDGHCELAHSVCVVASGDNGHPGEYPAYSPRTLAIGGTTLDLAGDGTIESEVAWPGSGGGESYFEPKPAAQQGVAPGPRRGLPDVSFDADPNTGVAVYDSIPYQGQSGWFQVGGTSVGTPVWSAILSSADQLRAAAGKGPLTSAGDQAARAVYAATSALGDITAGPPNGGCPKDCTAGPGYDFVTGLGSPRTAIDAAVAAAP